MKNKYFDHHDSFNVDIQGWGAHCHIVNNGDRILVFYARRAIMLINRKMRAYEKKHWDLGEEIGIDDKSAFIDDENAYWLTDYKELYHLDLNVNQMDRVGETNVPKNDSRGKLQYCKDKIGYICEDGVHIYSVLSKRYICTIPINSDPNSKVLFHPSSEIILFMTSDSVVAYRINPIEELWRITPPDWFWVEDYWEFSKDGRFLLLCPNESSIVVLDSFSGEVQASFSKGNDATIYRAHFSSDNRNIVACSGDGLVRVWNFEKAQKLVEDRRVGGNKFSYKDEILRSVFSEHKDNIVSDVMWLDDFSRIISFTQWDSTFYLWDVEAQEVFEQVTFEHPIDDYRLIQDNNGIKLIVVENTEGMRQNNSVRAIPPFIRVNEFLIN